MERTNASVRVADGSIRDITLGERVFWFCVFLAAAALVHGYRFGVSDACSQIPTAIRLFDPDYLRADWYVEATAGFNFRTPFGWLIGGFAQGVGWETAYLIVHVGMWYMLYDGILRISHLVTGSSRTGIIAVAIAMLLFANDTLTREFYTTPIPRKLAQAFALYGLYFWLRGRWIAGGILFGIATNFHLFTGGQAAALAAGAVFAHAVVRGRVPWRIWQGLAALVVIAAPMVIATLTMSVAGGADTELASYISGRLREAHHNLPSMIPVTSYLTHLPELGVALIAWSRMRIDGDGTAWERLGMFLVVTVAAMAVYGLLVELTAWPLLPTLSVFMNSFWLRVGAAIGIGFMIERVATGDDRRRLVTGGVIVAAVGGVLVHIAALHGVAILKVAIAAPVLAGVWLWVARPELQQWSAEHGRELAVAAIALLALTLGVPHAAKSMSFTDGSIAERGRTVLTERISVTPTPAGPEKEELIAWTRQNTASDALLLVPPHFECFRFRTDRAVVFDWKSPPYRVEDIVEWFRRAQRVTNTPAPPEEWPKGDAALPFIRDRYNALDEPALMSIVREYGATHIVREAGTAPLSFAPVFEGIGYRVYEVVPVPHAE